ncbi:outer membrane protein assembly factor BamA [Candidatus Pelagibacter sp.]|nr:outer membrane protein assembly factor BamA [Candidatus Pelagibacter sp.]
MKFLFNIFKIFLFYSFLLTSINAEIIEKIFINGNKRISDKTIQMFANIEIKDEISNKRLNLILKDLYGTNYFEDVSVSFENKILTIFVKENPIVQKINYKGVKSKTLLESIISDKLIREKSSYNLIILQDEKNRLNKIVKDMGYFNTEIEISVEKLDESLVNINFNINLGDKAKIKKISFIGNKVFKDSKLKRIIASTEYKFWKIISGKKYLNPSLVDLDIRLLNNFYVNNGYYNAAINSSFAKLLNDNEFELIFNIEAKDKIYFGELYLDLPIDFDKQNFESINKLFKKVSNEPYSINAINKILKEIDDITALEQYQFIKASVVENIVSDKINLTFKIDETEKLYVKKVNIYGNTVTDEAVIRNQLQLDEGDPYNEILFKKSINNIKSLNFFRSVDYNILDNDDLGTKTLEIFIEEKPTGEISATAGFGTEGGSIGFGIKENNFIGKGVSLDSNFLLSEESFKGKFAFTNPNYKNSDKSLSLSIEATENDNMEKFGYKSNKTGFEIATNFEYLDDFRLGLGLTNFYEVIKTDSTASEAQKKQKGNYWDSFLNLNFNYDKRNQKFQTSSGYRSYYSLALPIISENNTLKNFYNYSNYFDLYDQNISSFSLMFRTANSITNDDVKLSERINLPSSRLRGFEAGRVGPKDGEDFIGGNYAASVNFSSTLPQLLEESQNVDFSFFIDVANIWGVDYDNSIDDNGAIRSSTGIALDWFTPVGPLSFSLALPITKKNGDKTETFRFNLGTSF